MAFLLPLTYFLLCLAILYKLPFFKFSYLNKHILPAFFLLKTLVAIALMLVYTYYYTDRKTADIFKFFDDSILLHAVFNAQPSHFFRLLFGIDAANPEQLAHTKQMLFWNNSNPNELYNDSRIMIKINALLHFISFGYYGVHLVVFNFLSFVGLVAFYKAFLRFFDNKKQLFFIIFLIPSVLFWSSGILKESILILALGCLLYAFFEIIHQPLSIQKGILFMVSFTMLIFVKPYILGMILPAIFSYWIASKFPQKKALLFYLGTYTALILLGFSIKVINPNYDVLQIIAIKQNNFVNMARGGVYLHDGKKEVYIAYENRNFLTLLSDTTCKIKPNSHYEYRLRSAKKFTEVTNSNKDETIYRITFNAPTSGSLLTVKKLNPTFISFIKALPAALFNALFKPFIFTSFNPFLLLSGLENLLLFLFMLVVLFFKKTAVIINQNLLFFTFTIALSILIFVGLTTPVLGAMVRYKIPGLLFLIVGLLSLLDYEKLCKKIKQLKLDFFKKPPINPKLN